MGAKFEAIKHATSTGIMWHCENNLEQGSRIQDIVYGTARTEETNSIEEEFLCALRSQSHDNPEMSQDEIQQIYRMIERTYSYLKRDI